MRNAAVSTRFAVIDDIYVSAPLGFLYCFFSPRSCNDIIRTSPKKIQRYHRKLESRTALEEKNFIVVWQVQQVSDTAFGLRQNSLEKLRPVADLHHAHS